MKEKILIATTVILVLALTLTVSIIVIYAKNGDKKSIEESTTETIVETEESTTTETAEVTTETVEVTTTNMLSPDELQANIDDLERTSESLAEASASISESIEASISESIAESEREAQTEPPDTTARSYNPHLSESSISISVGNTDSFVSQAGGIELLDAPCDASLDYSGVDFYTAGSYTAYFNAFDGSFSLPLMVNVN